MRQLPRLTRYTLGTKIDTIFTDAIELCLFAGYAPRAQKMLVIQKLSTKIDQLKFFLKLLWEMRLLDNNKYTQCATPLYEVGKMIGGWMRSLTQ